MPRRFRLSLTLVLTLLACSSPTEPHVAGTWGGMDASLVLTPAGGAISYACGAGTIDSGWTLTAGGRLAGRGEHFFGGGPTPPQGRPPHPATYSGQVHGGHLMLTVTLTDLQLTLGPFSLRRGGPPVAEQCE
jgi:hypothetical protein